MTTIKRIVWTDPPQVEFDWSDEASGFSGTETVEMPGWTQPPAWQVKADAELLPVAQQNAANDLYRP